MPAGTYDAKLTDVSGRTCIVRNVKVEDGQIFSIEEKELTSCTIALARRGTSWQKHCAQSLIRMPA